MEDYIIREIDRIGELLVLIARRLGLWEGDNPDYSMDDVKDEFEKNYIPLDLDTILRQKSPIQYLVETQPVSEQGLETFIDILVHSDLEDNKKVSLLNEAIAYLDSKGHYSFKLHSLLSE